MEVTFTVRYADKTEAIITIEKPEGAAPNSPETLYTGLCVAEEVTGKAVERIGSPTDVPLFWDTDFPTRENIIRNMRQRGLGALKPEHR